MVINYFDETWTPKHVTTGLFEMHKIINNAMAL
jgi:hypothetical protein